MTLSTIIILTPKETNQLKFGHYWKHIRDAMSLHGFYTNINILKKPCIDNELSASFFDDSMTSYFRIKNRIRDCKVLINHYYNKPNYLPVMGEHHNFVTLSTSTILTDAAILKKIGTTLCEFFNVYFKNESLDEDFVQLKYDFTFDELEFPQRTKDILKPFDIDTMQKLTLQPKGVIIDLFKDDQDLFNALSRYAENYGFSVGYTEL